jgi:hypothetical protein
MSAFLVFAQVRNETRGHWQNKAAGGRVFRAGEV